jgi:4a-hydroxytetrahydrobiopterin dehydratase
MRIPLAKKTSTICNKETPLLSQEEIAKLLNELNELSELNNGWEVINFQRLKKEFKFVDFRLALNFTNKVGEIAEEENHHPDIYLSWGKVVIIIWTHVINGLSENDFILAAKISHIKT